MISMFLLDVPADPSGTGGLSLVLSGLVILLVLGFTALSLGALLFIFWRKRRTPKNHSSQARSHAAQVHS